MALGFFSRLKEGLTRSTQKLTTGHHHSVHPAQARRRAHWRSWRTC